ncbi:MAG: lipid-A-disaccharide synthase [Acidobacteria bacterium RIFCSPLOWO2_02_FULL_59_13]|nr:MAG: lipid-A-disaccharide synthase [Acidobacteria bacterium RIFCSPLOWO2_02_FULL_59_13]
MTARIFISAGEASGDLYGSLLISALRERLGTAEFFGCGGKRMRDAGCETVADAAELAMVGIVEILPGLPRAWKALRRLRAEIERRQPDLAILIDFPTFNLRFAKQCKRAGVSVVYFVAPQVWAWRTGRLKLLRQYVDRLHCIFPFEETFFRKAGIAAEFIGHPLAGRVRPTLSAEQFRARWGLPDKPPLIALLPGSRRREIELNLPPMLEAVRLLAEKGQYCFVAAAAPAAGPWIRASLEKARLAFPVVENQTYNALAHATVAIVASGTATVETALLGTPMVVVYRVTPLTWLLGRGLVRTPFYSMVNLVAGRRIVPEFIQDRFQPEAVAREARQLLESADLRQRMREGLREVAERLLPAAAKQINEDPIQRSAAAIESMLIEAHPLSLQAR